MRVLLDECLPQPLADDFPDAFDVGTVPQAGWSGLSDSALLTRAQDHYDAFITVDAGIEYEQTLSAFDITVVILTAPTNRLADLTPLVPSIVDTLHQTHQPTIHHIS